MASKPPPPPPRRVRRVPLPTPEQIARAAVLSDPTSLDDRYEVLRGLGQGGMARVYEVRCRRYDRRLALKVLRPDVPNLEQVVARFEREAELLRRLDHPNCVRLIEWGRTRQGGLYLLMELADGVPLTSRLGESMPVARALEIIRQVLLALQHAHQGGIVHRDIKPDNVILLETAGRMPLVKLLDFGLGKLVNDSPFAVADRHARPERRLTGGVAIGTPTYMAPEIMIGEPADYRSDLYSVGVMLHYLLTGRKPFVGKDIYAVMRAKLQRPAPLLSQVAPNTFSPALERAVARSLSREPVRRFSCAAEFLNAIVVIQRSPGRGLAVAEPASTGGGWRDATRKLVQRIRRVATGELQVESA